VGSHSSAPASLCRATGFAAQPALPRNRLCRATKAVAPAEVPKRIKEFLAFSKRVRVEGNFRARFLILLMPKKEDASSSKTSRQSSSPPAKARNVERGARAQKRGMSGEEVAAAFLESKGVQILKRNWRAPGFGLRGEVDLVARAGGFVCFVEVKTRKSSEYGEPQEAVGSAKRAQLERLARAWMQLFPADESLRFDIIEIWWAEDGSNPRVAWIENAFEARV
jgi:putative endonuclease